ncbi:hypothetical protein CSUI_010225 [Cystoisospora suis]|uniref:Uncharacterized protein n=1 Tax=Cystoisospora suis TaxID=483139 RepID=A0A2C6KHF9_9APIC|nr:hypothetical protein CSUI_010225 [Cystoisospora suis]
MQSSFKLRCRLLLCCFRVGERHLPKEPRPTDPTSLAILGRHSRLGAPLVVKSLFPHNLLDLVALHLIASSLTDIEGPLDSNRSPTWTSPNAAAAQALCFPVIPRRTNAVRSTCLGQRPAHNSDQMEPDWVHCGKISGNRGKCERGRPDQIPPFTRPFGIVGRLEVLCRASPWLALPFGLQPKIRDYSNRQR